MTDSEKGSPSSENAEGDQPRAEGQSPAVKPEEPHVENPDTRPPAGQYGVVPSKREEPASSFAAGHLHPLGEGAQGFRGASSIWQARRLSQPSIEGMLKPASSQTRVYAAVGVALGLLVGLAAAVTFLHPTGGGPNDLGAFNAGEFGLRGHLITSWKEKLEYQLTVEPGDPSQRAAFSFDVNASPRPLSVVVQVKDPSGAVLCGDAVLLKFNPRNAPYGAVNPGPEAGKLQRDIAAKNEIAQGIKLAREESQELDREHGRSLFQNVVGPDGQIASISAQGTLPCTRKQFENVASWSFTSDFPVVSIPAGDRTSSSKPDAQGDSSSAGESSETSRKVAKPSAAGAAKRRPAQVSPPIYVEGDDAIVWFDASTGLIETTAGKTLVIDKTDAVATALKGRDLPIPIHYRCEQSGACMFAGVGAGAEHARLRR